MQNGAEPAGASSLKNIIPDIALPVQKTFSQTVKMTVLVLTHKKSHYQTGATRRGYSKH
ncbi:hypothetical protein SNSL317_A0455 [Salmonella enterica subsp. enterica serovar Newport str. SL317]|nr:hypothetical protein SNSL317_A0455 [Salmonella enterica subsp. enterica serovar Newport str. SL317]